MRLAHRLAHTLNANWNRSVMAQQLPHSLLDLIEHVELNQSGWWDIALSNVLLATTWMHGESVPREQVKDLVISAFSLDLPADRIADCIERLVSQGKLNIHHDDYIAPADSVANQMEIRLKAAQHNEDTVSAAFG